MAVAFNRPGKKKEGPKSRRKIDFDPREQIGPSREELIAMAVMAAIIVLFFLYRML